MLNWFKDLLGLKTSKKLPVNYDGLLKSDMLFEVGTLVSLLNLIRSTKKEFDGIDNNIVLQMIYAEEHVEKALESLNEGLQDCVDDALEDGEYPIFMGWNEDEE